MPGRCDEVAGVLSNALLCTVCLGAAVQTFQINRGAAAGFLLQALVPLMETAALLAAPLGLSLDARPPDDSWVSTVVGLPLLVFGFHWLNGDCSTANLLLGGALLLTASSGYFTEEGKAVVAHSVTLLASITILIVSVFTGNVCGVVGSLLVGTAGLLEGATLQRLLLLRKKDLLRALMAAAHLALQWALQRQHQELEQGPVGLGAEASG
ncbi:transmembrane protein 276 [Hemicordylus capensis]|uniref:transmembrane protein 276 n=1 Tax=Hemicordylus capensis TaxID=884348 RepID=UPI0023042338|nr:transmembrane protein 276 [Hemicordylus capensis]